MNAFFLPKNVVGPVEPHTENANSSQTDVKPDPLDSGADNTNAPTPKNPDAQLIAEQQLRGVKAVARVTLIACAISLPFPFGIMTLLDFWLGLAMLGIVTVVGAYGAVVLILLSRGRYRPWLNWLGAAIEVSVPTAIALADSARIGPAYALTSAPVMLYGLAVLSSALRLRPRLVLFSGGLGAVQILLLYAMVYDRIDSDLVAQLPSLAVSNIIQRATYILLAGILGWFLCRSLLRLAQDLSTQWLARQKSEQQRRALEEQLHQAQKMEAIGQLAGGIAHDFNNLLTTIMGYSSLVEQSVTDPELLNDIREIKDSGQRAVELTSQLLAFSRKQTFQKRVVDLNCLVSDAGRMLAPIVGTGIALQSHPDSEPLYTRVDCNRLESVLINLVVNARDAIREVRQKDGVITIATGRSWEDTGTTRTPDTGWVFLSVSDNGAGMTPEMTNRIFEPFFTTKAQGKGTGLGLATAYGIINQFGGHLTVDSAPSKGSTFRILLPASNMKPKEEEPKPMTETAGGGETILVVEDEPDLRRFAVRVLRNVGYEVLSAESAQSAIKLTNDYKERIHLLLTDVVMPGQTGKELWDTLHPSRPELRLLYMSGYARNILGEHVSLAPDTPLLPKPFSPAELECKVREVLDSARITPLPA
ncbi:MAG: response regulator [Deltaproteobacteria bacterium]|nr:response regulator [Deltaproteobacteria bacterium]